MNKECESRHLCLPKGAFQALLSHFLSGCSCSCTRWRQGRPTTLSCWLFGRYLLGCRTNREALRLSSSDLGTASHRRWHRSSSSLLDLALGGRRPFGTMWDKDANELDEEEEPQLQQWITRLGLRNSITGCRLVRFRSSPPWLRPDPRAAGSWSCSCRRGARPRLAARLAP